MYVPEEGRDVVVERVANNGVHYIEQKYGKLSSLEFLLRKRNARASGINTHSRSRSRSRSWRRTGYGKSQSHNTK